MVACVYDLVGYRTALHHGARDVGLGQSYASLHIRIRTDTCFLPCELSLSMV